MIESVEQLVETEHGRIYVECEDDPARDSIVLAAGGPGVGHDHYHPWFSRLAGHSAVVYFDYSGCGRSDRLSDGREYSVELFADNIDAVRRQLELDAIDLIGLSFRRLRGGRVRVAGADGGSPARPQQRPGLRRELAAEEHRKRQRRPARPRHFITEAGMGYRFEPEPRGA